MPAKKHAKSVNGGNRTSFAPAYPPMKFHAVLSTRTQAILQVYAFLLLAAGPLSAMTITQLRSLPYIESLSNLDSVLFAAGFASLVAFVILWIRYPRMTQGANYRILVAFGGAEIGLLALTTSDRIASDLEVSELTLVCTSILILGVFKPPLLSHLNFVVRCIAIFVSGLLILYFFGRVSQFVSNLQASPPALGASAVLGGLDSLFPVNTLAFGVLGILLLVRGLTTHARTEQKVYTALGICSTLVSDSRILTAVAIAVICMLIVGARLSWRRIWLLRPYVAAGLIVLLLASLALQTRAVFELDQFRSQASSTTEQVTQPEGRLRSLANEGLTGRLDIWTVHWRGIREDPWSLRGAGSAGVISNVDRIVARDNLPTRVDHYAAHNLGLETWHRFGLLGIVLVTILLGASFLLAWRAFKGSGQLFGLGLCFSIVLIGLTEHALAWVEVTTSVMVLNLASFWSFQEIRRQTRQRHG